MKFFKSLRKSLYDVQYYHNEWQQYTFWKAVWRYTRLFFLIFFILGTIGIVIFGHFFTKENLIKWANIAKDIAIQWYPSGLVLDISAESGVVTNSTGPIVFSTASIENIFSGKEFMMNNRDSKNRWRYSKGYENILVIDPNSSGSIESYNTIILLNKTQLIAQANKNEKRVYEVAQAMKGNPAIHITPEIVQSTMNGIVNTITSNAGKIINVSHIVVSVLSLIVLVFGSFLVGLFAALSLYLYALIIWGLSKILKTEYSYKQIYSMSVLGFSLPFCLIFASTFVRVIVLCIIIGRVMYLHKQWNEANGISSSK